MEAAAKTSIEEEFKRLAESQAKALAEKNAKIAAEKLKAANDAKKKEEEENARLIAEEAKRKAQASQQLVSEDLKKTMNKEDYLSELAKKYPQGVTSEEIDGLNCKILRVIVVTDTKANEFKRITYKYGTFFKKNDLDITEATFKRETKL